MRKSPLIVLLLAFAMLIAACASTGDEETTTAAAAEETTTTAAAATDETTTTAAAEETTTTAVDPTADWPEEILFGFIPSEKQEKLADTVQPYMDYLTEELGITFTGIITADYNGLVVAMGAGNADLGAFGPFGYVQAQEQYPEIGVLIQSIRFGSDLYHGQWFTNDPSICEDEPVIGAYEWVDGVPTIMDPTEVPALQVGWAYNDGVLGPEVLEDGQAVAQGLVCTASLEAVKGKSIAFTSATSTSGGVFPQLQLFNLGIDIEEDLEYSYLTSHDATVAAVYNGDFDIGLSFDDARRTLRKEKTDVGQKVIVFNITDDIPNDVVAVRGGLPESLQLAIFDATKTYLGTEEGEAIFDEIYGWTDIRLARDEDFDVVREAAVKLGVADE
ncbi:MAG: PhnD/SsuA/transferrin family substrate-binding protein [Actinomycetia bacterium]|nr:PhnD/SsuA/transferrin family substrate-binding protein [Actinomycetes bacterium]